MGSEMCIRASSQAGYNTVMDLLVARCPAVIVPFATGGETEQTIRAEKLSQAGVLINLPEKELSTSNLSDAALLAISQKQNVINAKRDMNGIAATARLVERFMN